VRRELFSAVRDVDAAFPMLDDDAPDVAWDVYGAVDGMLAAVAGGARRRGFGVAGSLAFADGVRQLETWKDHVDEAQLAAVERLRQAVAAAERT
jgi:hypothetical protein